MRASGRLDVLGWPALAFATGAALLAVEPARWLITTWTDPSYASNGVWIALSAVGLFAWSASSAPGFADPGARRRAIWLLAGSAAVRLAGQVLGVNVLSAMTLGVDCYALARLLGLDRRRRAVSCAWLAALFTLSLPLERAIQRVTGYALQALSADASCWLLALGPLDVGCEGLRIVLEGRDVLVDLPCSGTRGLTLLLTLYVALAACLRPSARAAVAGFALTLAAAFAANVLRIVLLALGIARPHWIGGAPVMEAPAHEIVGLLSLCAGAAPIVFWALRRPERTRAPRKPHRTLADVLPGRRRSGAAAALSFAAAAAIIVSLPARPLDVARREAAPELPTSLAGAVAKTSALDTRERAYFTRYGGGASRAHYGEHALLVVRTTAPLRHLHAPDECLRGSHLRVRYLGQSHTGVPTALYRATDANGNRWRVAASFVSGRGEITSSVGHAVWLWLAQPGTAWTMVQRVSPWDADPASTAEFEAHVLRAFDLAPHRAAQARSPSPMNES